MQQWKILKYKRQTMVTGYCSFNKHFLAKNTCLRSSPIMRTFEVVPSPVMSSCKKNYVKKYIADDV